MALVIGVQQVVFWERIGKPFHPGTSSCGLTVCRKQATRVRRQRKLACWNVPPWPSSVDSILWRCAPHVS